MATKIKPLRKFSTGAPSASDIEAGELAVNTADQKIYMRDDSNNIVEVANASGSAADDITTGDAAVTIATSSGNITLDAQGNDTDIIFKGTDGGSDITALTLDMSAGGSATFNNNVQVGGLLYLDGNIDFTVNGKIIQFGASNDVTLTHVTNTGLLLNSTSQLQFGDSGTYIHQSADGVLDLVSDTEIEINATTVDINATTVDITANLTLTSTDAGSGAAPTLTLKRDSSSPASFDNQGTIQFLGENTASEHITYGEIRVQASTVTDGSEESRMVFSVMNDGAEKEMMFLDAHQGGGVLYLTAGIDLLFEGADSSKETTLTVANATADRTITLPDATGQVVLSSGHIDADSFAEIGRAHVGYVGWSDIAGFSHVDQNTQTSYALLHQADGTTYLNAPTGKNIKIRNNNLNIADFNSGGLYLYSTKIIAFEGSAANDFETSLTVAGPTADRTVTLPDATGTVVVSASSPLTINTAGNMSLGAVSVAADNITTGDAEVTIATSAGQITIDNQASDQDIVFKGTDNTTDVTALTLDMSDAGKAIFNAGATFANDVTITSSGLSDSPNLRLNNSETSNSFGKAIEAYRSGITTGKRHQILLGKDSSNYDTSAISYYYAGSASTSNRLEFGFWGADELLNIIGDGKVGIGTTSPSSLLEVNGAATATKMISNATINKYGSASAPIVFAVTVATQTAAHPYNGDGSSNKYSIDGVEGAALELHGADSVTSNSQYVYRFDQADSSNSGHPLLFYLNADKTGPYTTGVSTNGTPGNAGAYTQIAVTRETPKTLYYQCSNHAYMGNYVTVENSNVSLSGGTDSNSDANLSGDFGNWIRIGDAAGGISKSMSNGYGIKLHDSGVIHWSVGGLGTDFLISKTHTNGGQLFPSGRNDVFKINTGGNTTITGATTLTTIELGHASDTTISRSAAGTVQIEGNTILTVGNSDAPTTTTSSGDADFVLVDDGGTMKKITPANLGVGSGGGGSGITVQDEGSGLSTAGTTLNFVGAGVVASGTGATKTITISGSGSGITTGKSIAMAMVFG